MKKDNQEITVGSTVQFESDQGMLVGTVGDIKPNISNGQAIAFVHVRGTLDNLPWKLPVNELKHSRLAA